MNGDDIYPILPDKSFFFFKIICANMVVDWVPMLKVVMNTRRKFLVVEKPHSDGRIKSFRRSPSWEGYNPSACWKSTILVDEATSLAYNSIRIQRSKDKESLLNPCFKGEIHPSLLIKSPKFRGTNA